MLSIVGLFKKYQNKPILKNLNTSFDEQGVSIIVGMNGSGKTTLLNCITGLIRFDSGQVMMGEHCNDSIEFKEQLFYLPSDFYLPEYLTGNEYAKFIFTRFKNSDLSKFDVITKMLDLNEFLDVTLEAYSFGMKKKIQIAIALSVNVKYLIGDEIFSGLDFETTLLVQELIKQTAKTKKIIIVSHDSSTLDFYPDDLRILQHGVLSKYTGSAKELINEFRDKEGFRDKLNQLAKY
ncbi:MAG: ABC transporter ATP-binding protein [Lactobacillaceae bacterium]|nr:ABC transporter ATP-binding protein [Lactobacillaceae bacterium]